MQSLGLKHLKTVTNFVMTMTFLALAACSSKQVVNEAAMLEPIDGIDHIEDSTPEPLDQDEFSTRQNLESESAPLKAPKKKFSRQKQVAKLKAERSSKQRLKKIAKLRNAKKKQFKAEPETLPAIGSVVNSNGEPPVPPTGELNIEGLGSDERAVIGLEKPETDFSAVLIDNWKYIFGVFLIGMLSWASYARVSNKRKRRLVFN